MSSRVRAPRAGRPGSRGGSVAAEFALTGTLLLLLLFAMVDFGLLINARLVLTAAAREGARRAAVEGGATAVVRERIEQQLRLGQIDVGAVLIEIEPPSAAYGTAISVRLSYTYRFLTPIIAAAFGQGVPMTVEMVTRSERVGTR